MLIRLLFIARRRWPILLLLPLVAVGVAAAFQPRGGAKLPTTYSASSLIAVQPTTSATAVNQLIVAVTAGEPAAAVRKELGPRAAEVTPTIRFVERQAVVDATATSEDPDLAVAASKAYADAFISYGNENLTGSSLEQLADAEAAATKAQEDLETFTREHADALAQNPVPPEVEVLRQARLTDLASAQTRVRDLRAQGPANLPFSAITYGTAAKDSASKLQLPADLRLRAVIGFCLGLVGAIALVAIVEKLNPRIDDPGDAEQIIGAPVLSMVPVMRGRRGRVLARADPATFQGPFAESFRGLRSHLDFRALAEERDLPPRLLVVSATPAEGKTTTATFLALSYAKTDRAALVIGGDVRRPTVHERFDVARIPGLTDLESSGDIAASVAEVMARDEVSGVSVIPSGHSTANVTRIVPKLTAITRAGQRSDRPVIVDSAPVMVANDSIDYLAAVDWVIMVVRVGRSTERAVRKAVAALRLNKAEIVGVVMVGSLESTDAKRYYYNYYADDPKHAR